MTLSLCVTFHTKQKSSYLLKLFLSLSSNHFRSYVKHVTNMWSRPYSRIYEILGLNIVFVSNGMLANIICRLVSSCLKKENTIFKEIAPIIFPMCIMLHTILCENKCPMTWQNRFQIWPTFKHTTFPNNDVKGPWKIQSKLRLLSWCRCSLDWFCFSSKYYWIF